MAKVGHLLERRIDEALQRKGLTLRQFSALVHVARSPGLSSSDLARLLLTTPQAVNTLVARLVAAGLLHRAETRSRQPLVLTLTATGLQVLQDAATIATEAEAAALAQLDRADVAQTERTLRTLLDCLRDSP